MFAQEHHDYKLTPPPTDPYIFQEVLFKVGFALWQIQELETTLANYLVMVHKLEPGVAQQEAETVFEKTRKKTFGQLLGELKKHDSGNSLLQRLDEFVEHRNWLAHRSRDESRKQFYQPYRTNELYAKLDWIAEEALAVMKLLFIELTGHLESHGLDMNAVDKHAAAIMDGWQRK